MIMNVYLFYFLLNLYFIVRYLFGDLCLSQTVYIHLSISFFSYSSTKIFKIVHEVFEKVL